MADWNPRPVQLFVRLLDGRSATLTFPSPHAYGHQIKRRIFELTKIPTNLQRLICGGYQISDTGEVSLPDSTVNLVLSLRGGKGGFGSLLRGAATKAGQKKTNNFDACRDMSGRRLRHVNAEKKLEEWKAEEDERKLEKLAQEFLKKQAKKGKQGVGDGAVQKYVDKYRKESDKCIEAVELALKESFQHGKRKGKTGADSEKSKRLKIWKGKRVMGDSDSDDSSDEEDGEEDVNGSQVASDKDTEGSSGSAMGRAHDGDSSGGASCERSGSEEEKDVVGHHSSDAPVVTSEKAGQAEKGEDSSGEERKNSVEIACQPSMLSSLANDETVKEATDSAMNQAVETNSAAEDDDKSDKSEKPLNFDDFGSAAEMENLGMERLKMELQKRGMKCGGTLQERASRLFLLKSTPFHELPKKLLAKK
ncbi:PREDICTED: protein SDE2 homolog isoform X2 [Tarenaya hassleriana]|uniref:protein SDE2 homolog isoform X1 n=1 Tax=Tarenaya hassleriana TaxID=28532 RepID=UPI00053C0FC8|nr:PREDICTED: protein SDE2 homolog isoform X1 [Tarenaya hassleriana]XP_010544432.1 PREDICTED: protein SDE2 homolog isoform X2 [Tarenaya hassleriana]